MARELIMLGIVLTLYLLMALACLVFLLVKTIDLFFEDPIRYPIMIIMGSLFWPIMLTQFCMFYQVDHDDL